MQVRLAVGSGVGAWRRPVRRPGLLAGLLTVLLALTVPGLAQAADDQAKRDDRPERGLSMYTDYSGVVVPLEETVRMELTVENRGKQDETVALKLATVPKGWKASLKGGNFTVTGVSVASGKTRTLTFSAEPEKGVGPGTYVFDIEGVSADGKLTLKQPISVTTRERSRLGTGDIQITTSYPVLRGQNDAQFEFSLDVANKSDNDRTFNLAAQVPENWEVNFKPGFESKQISSLRIRGASSQTVAVQVTPARGAVAGEYPVQFRVTTGESKAEAKLMVVLTGTYKLDAATPTGILSAEAVTGKPTTVSFLVKNTGSAVNRNISLSAFKPENWKVEFKPEKLEALEPGAFKQVEATITPSATALVGDYSVGLSSDGEKGSSKTVELRVTVKAPTAWGWFGVGLIALVIGGMGGLFVWLGRR
ncbi:MAG TPA: NEW3 domain-containing protein [Candidatus Methylomirabilis sp.]|nr:NEW3 domain-containing protein [Candidatus Methylomirabilis sp.]HSC70873.1 NEW3 domain-containing protein [Candidatus Methylomirabilis sp.]